MIIYFWNITEKEHALPPKQKPLGEMKPSKPMAHLTSTFTSDSCFRC